MVVEEKDVDLHPVPGPRSPLPVLIFSTKLSGEVGERVQVNRNTVFHSRFRVSRFRTQKPILSSENILFVFTLGFTIVGRNVSVYPNLPT